MPRIFSLALAALWLVNSHAEVVRVVDDREIAVPSVVFVEGVRVGPTDDRGVLELASASCSAGAEVTAVPIDDEQAYILPSSRGRCLGRVAPVSVVVSRRLLVGNLQTWIDAAAKNQDWGLAAHSLSEKYQLTRNSDPGAEQTKRALFEASSRAIGLSPDVALVFDPRQQKTVMSPAFADALVAWKKDRGIEAPTPVLDGQFFNTASPRTSAMLLYHTAEITE